MILFSMLFCACVAHRTISVHIMLHCIVSPKVLSWDGSSWRERYSLVSDSLVMIDRFT